jgi:hypothetical protein
MTVKAKAEMWAIPALKAIVNMCNQVVCACVCTRMAINKILNPLILSQNLVNA